MILLRKIFNKSTFVKEEVLPFVILCMGFLYVSLPLFHDGFFPTMDDVQVVRIGEMAKELLHGQFPVRYVNDLGNGGGYMLFNFYPPFAYYIGASLHIIGFSLVKATKLVFILGFFFCIGGMYLLLRSITDKILSAVGALLLGTAPYYVFEVYTRGALAEFFAFSLLPILLWLYTHLLKDKIKFIPFLTFATVLAAVFLSHTFVGVIMIVYLGLTSLFHKRIVYTLSAILLGIVMSSFFWLPMVVEQEQTRYQLSDYATKAYKTSFITIMESAGIGSSHFTFKPPLLGIVLFFSSILGSIYAIRGLTSNKKIPAVVLLAAGGGLLSFILSSPLSTLLWDFIPPLQAMQYPWRFQVFTTVFAVLLTIFLIHQIRPAIVKLFVAFVLLGLQIGLYQSYYRPSGYTYVSTYYAEDPCGTTTWESEYLPRTVKTCLKRSKTREALTPQVQVSDGADMLSYRESSHGRNVTLEVDGSGSETVTVRKYFLQNWNVRTDTGEISNTYPSPEAGLLSFRTKDGKINYSVTFAQTPIEQIGNALSILSGILAYPFYLIVKRSIIEGQA